MKKLLSILLAAMLVMAMTVTAFAADEDAESPADPTSTETADVGVQPENITLTKEYKMDGGAAAPVETLEFEVTLKSGVDGGVEGNLVVKLNAEATDVNKFTTSGEAETDFILQFPVFTKMGVYTYEVKEKAGSTLGVTYDPEPIKVIVTVTNAPTAANADNLVASVSIYKKVTNTEGVSKEEKIEGPNPTSDAAAFTNTFGQGQLTVSKTVTGNLASNTKKFTIHVTFTGANAKSEITYTVAGGAEQKTTSLVASGSASVDIELSNEQSAVFTNIPAGVTYTVVEDSKHFEGSESPETTEEGYKATYTFSDTEKKIAAKDTDTAEILNTKKTDINTGIVLDSLPYVLVIGAVAAAMVVMIIRKRREVEG